MGSIRSSRRDLAAALTEAHQQYEKKHQASQSSHERACRVMPGGNTRTVLHTTPFPLSIASGQSSTLTTVDGHQYVDFLNEYTAGIYGHNHPAIKHAIEGALQHGWNYGAHHDKEEALATLICARFPSVELVRFVNSGTEANMMALATALAFTNKKKILLFEKAYHGSTISGQFGSGKPSINLPHDFVIGKYNDVEGTRQILRDNDLAAILVEPMLGSGGCFAGSKEFLQTLRTACTESNALLIFDEVMTSRLQYRGQGDHMGITPDLMTMGKYVGGGMSFGAFGGRRNIMDLYDPRTGRLEHPGTFNNNVFSMSAGIVGAKILTPQILTSLNGLGERMRAKIENVLKEHGIEGRIPHAPLTDDMPQAKERPPKMFIKGVGSLMCVHFVGPDQSLLQGLFFHHMLDHGIYIAQRGFIALSIENNLTQVNDFVDAVSQFCDHFNEDLHW